ncbi:oxidoreductase [Acinetobacter sp. XH1639]|uniref:oxidoreductase n=1 Tax=Acinetobacter sp. XH1639 TaxID=3157368 RepID=UPI0032B416B3
MSKVTWTPEQIPSMIGKTVLVTGANSGLGFESARLMAAHGAEVIMACRDQKKGILAVENIKEEYPEAKLVLMSLDLADQQAIKAFVQVFKEKYQKLDILLNNAGLMAPPLSRTKDGFEIQFGTNHLGHFTLTGLLLDVLERADKPRIVTVSSVAHNFGKIYFNNLNAEKCYFRWAFYGQSKLANLIFSRELHRRLRLTESKIDSIAVHPGYSDTNLQNASGTAVFNCFFAQPQSMGCYPSVFAATSSEAESGGYYGPNGFMEMAGYPAPARVRKLAKDQNLAEQLWQVSEQLTGVCYLNVV